MISPPTPVDEKQRLATLRATQLLDSPAEERFDWVTRVARRLFGVPIALVSLVDANRQWFKSKQGLTATETSREISFCGHAILTDGPLVVEDALKDTRFSDNPLVTGDPQIRFYAGYPLAALDGSKLGTLCIIGDLARQFCAEDRMVLQKLASLIETELSAPDLATNDLGTGLVNLSGFLEIGDYFLRLSKKLNCPVQLLVIHVGPPVEGNFASLSTEEHSVATSIARHLVSIFDHSDLSARIGPREFAVLLPESGTGRVSHDMRLAELADRLTAYAQYPTGGSIACAAVQYDPSKHSSVEDLLAEAERCIQTLSPHRIVL